MSKKATVIPFKAEAHPISFVYTRSFERDARRVFTNEELTGLLNYISANPDKGARLVGGSGLRKMRWKANGFGKSGGARVIYYFRDLNMPLLLLAVYPKNERADLSKKEIAAIEQKMRHIVDAFCGVRQQRRVSA